MLKHGVGDAVIDHQLLFPLGLTVGLVDRTKSLTDFVVDCFLEGLGSLIETRLDRRGVLFDGDLRILVEVINDPALALSDRLRAELFLGEFIAPVAEAAFGKFLNIPLVNEGYTLAFVGQRVLDSAPDQALGSSRRNRLDANSGVPADLLLAAF